MNRSERIARRDGRLWILGMLFIILGGGLVVSAAIHIVKSPTFAILATQDGMIRWIEANVCEIGWIGACISILGILLTWSAEDSQEALRKRSRFVDYDELKELQASRR